MAIYLLAAAAVAAVILKIAAKVQNMSASFDALKAEVARLETVVDLVVAKLGETPAPPTGETVDPAEVEAIRAEVGAIADKLSAAAGVTPKAS